MEIWYFLKEAAPVITMFSSGGVFYLAVRSQIKNRTYPNMVRNDTALTQTKVSATSTEEEEVIIKAPSRKSLPLFLPSFSLLFFILMMVILFVVSDLSKILVVSLSVNSVFITITVIWLWANISINTFNVNRLFAEINKEVK